jgi:hypothetical protein
MATGEEQANTLLLACCYQEVFLTMDNSALDATNACYIAFRPGINYINLVDDTGQVLSQPIVLGSGGQLSNSQCTVYASGSSSTIQGSQLVVTLNISFNSGFQGPNIIYVAGFDANGNSGWQSLGAWQ